MTTSLAWVVCTNLPPHIYLQHVEEIFCLSAFDRHPLTASPDVFSFYIFIYFLQFKGFCIQAHEGATNYKDNIRKHNYLGEVTSMSTSIVD